MNVGLRGRNRLSVQLVVVGSFTMELQDVFRRQKQHKCIL